MFNYYDSSPTLINGVFWGNRDAGGTGESAQIHIREDSSAVIHYTCVQGWSGKLGGTGNIGDDPMFVDADGPDNIPGTEDDDLRLSPGSPAIDAGINPALPPDTTDLDGDGDTVEPIPVDLNGVPRFMDISGIPDTGFGTPPIVDMGAYEHLIDCNSNGVPDRKDIRKGTSLDCNKNGIPDECEPSQDCNANGVCDDEDIKKGTSKDCNKNVIPDECEVDCNGNQVPDDCDIAEGTSEDCNDDGIPDECLTSKLDCNDNGLVDECETREGVTPDENNNGRPDECEPKTLYVDPNATGINNGTSWTDAFNELQDALAVAGESRGFVEEVWVAAGTYTPTAPGGSRLESFRLRTGIGIYGGFIGVETKRHQRSPKANKTILSGDLNGDDKCDFYDISRIDNSYHIVISRDTDETTVLDGFTIMAGHATALSPVERDRGAGMWNNGSPMLANLRFTGNWAVGSGGGIYTLGEPRMSHCTFVDNASEELGGAMFVEGLPLREEPFQPTIDNCTFSANSSKRGGGLMVKGYPVKLTLTNCKFISNMARNMGGGLYVDNNKDLKLTNCLFTRNEAPYGGGSHLDGEDTLINCVFVDNTAFIKGGGIWASAGDGIYHSLSNGIFWGNRDSTGMGEFAQIFLSNINDPKVAVNHSCVQGWTGQMGGTGNIGDDPRFMDPDHDDYRLGPGSPCIDAADNEAVPQGIETDLAGKPRFIDDPNAPDTGNGSPPIVDMGPYEFQIGEDCTGREKLRARCKGEPGMGTIKATLKKGRPGITVTFRLDSDRKTDLLRTVAENGKAKAKFRLLLGGEYIVGIVECGMRSETRCP